MDDAIIMSPPKLSKGRKWATLAVLLFGQFVVSIDMTVLTVSLPDITSDLRPTSDQQLWMVDAYSLVLTSLLVSMSTLSDRWGRKRMLLAGFLLFGIVSALVLAASTPQQVIGIRVLMGTASAMIMPTTISTIRSVFLDPKERAFALAAWSSIAGLGSVAGPIVGGFLVEHFSWHAAFLVNVPLMAIGIVVGAAAVPEIRVKHPGHWDALGAAMTLGGMVGVMWGIKHIAAVMAVDAAGAAALVIGFALLAAFVRRCLRSEHPLIEVSLFRSKPFTAGMLCAVGLVFAMASLTFLMSQWFQLVGGSSPLEAGLLLAPMAAISVFAGFGGVPLALKMGARAVIAGGLFAAALGMVSMILSIGNVSTGSIVFASCLVGLGTGAFAVASSVIACATPVEKASSAAALEETAYDFGNVLGISTLGSLVSVIYRLGLDPAVLANAGLDAGSFAESMESYGAAVDIAQSTGVAELVIEGAAAYSDGIAIACFVGGMIMIVASIVIWKLVPKSLNITEEEA